MNLDILKKIKQPIFYVTNDPSRAIGLENFLPNYHIICLDDHPLVDLMLKKNISVFCLEKHLKRKNLLIRSSSEILNHQSVLSFIKEKSKGQTAGLVFFKPQRKIEIIAQKNNFLLVGNSSSLNKAFEDKINFYKIACKENLPVLPAEIVNLNEIDFNYCAKKFGLPFVIQFGFGWAGNSTFFVKSQKQIFEIQEKHGRILVKISRFIKGLTVLNNAVVLPDAVLLSPPAVQVKSHPDLTLMPGGTGGRQWPAGISSNQAEKIRRITQKVGEIMRHKGYWGFFGLDFLIEEDTNEIYLSENNARLTASASFYTQLELKNSCFPLFFFHLLVFLDKSLLKNFSYQPERDKIFGSELIGRNIFSRPMEVTKSLYPGIYDQNLCFQKEDYFLNDPRKNKFWLSTAAEGRIVNPEIEMIKINTFESVCDSNGNLNQVFGDIIKKTRAQIETKNA